MSFHPNAAEATASTPARRLIGSGRVRVRDAKAVTIGFALLGLYCLQDAFALKLSVLESWQASKAFKIATGVVLLAFILDQWRLSLARARRDTRAAKPLYRRHGSLGLVAPALLFLHATSFGHGYLVALAGTFLATCALGVVNRQNLDLESRSFWHCWMIAHVGLATLLLFLVVFHAYVVAYYE